MGGRVAELHVVMMNKAPCNQHAVQRPGSVRAGRWSIPQYRGGFPIRIQPWPGCGCRRILCAWDLGEGPYGLQAGLCTGPCRSVARENGGDSAGPIKTCTVPFTAQQLVPRKPRIDAPRVSHFSSHRFLSRHTVPAESLRYGCTPSRLPPCRKMKGGYSGDALSKIMAEYHKTAQQLLFLLPGYHNGQTQDSHYRDELSHVLSCRRRCAVSSGDETLHDWSHVPRWRGR